MVFSQIQWWQALKQRTSIVSATPLDSKSTLLLKVSAASGPDYGFEAWSQALTVLEPSLLATMFILWKLGCERVGIRLDTVNRWTQTGLRTPCTKKLQKIWNLLDPVVRDLSSLHTLVAFAVWAIPSMYVYVCWYTKLSGRPAVSPLPPLTSTPHPSSSSNLHSTSLLLPPASSAFQQQCCHAYRQFSMAICNNSQKEVREW